MTAHRDAQLAAAKRHLGAREFDTAADILSELVSADPGDAEALHLLGLVSFNIGRLDDAIALIEAAVERAPTMDEAWSNLATVLMSAERLDDARQAQERALTLQPRAAAYHFNLGNIHTAQSKESAGCDAFRAALALQPHFPEAWSNLGTALRNMDDVPGAYDAFATACAQQPGYIEARYNLANALRDLGRLTEAEAEFQTIITANPQHAKTYNSLGNLLSDMGRPIEARDAFRRATQIDPAWMPAVSNLLSSEHYIPGVTSSALVIAHRQWAARFAVAHSPDVPVFKGLDRSPDRPLTVGFVSPDFGAHPVGYLSVRVFENLDRARITPVIFSTRPELHEDAISKRIMAVAEWRRVDGLSDIALANDIRIRAVDILFDMSGHTAGHRLLTFARKPAPLQVSWIGYVGTTGLSTMDYILADGVHAPIDETLPGPEHALRMPHGYVCFDPPVEAPDVGPAPVDLTGRVTFGCLNNPAKLNDDVIATFARILVEVPGSRLVLRFKGLEDSGVQNRLFAAFGRHQVSADRIIIKGRAARADFLNTYNEIDIALDTFPYSGGLTTCEALWMGVPVITYPGATFAGRHASSHLSAAGYPELVQINRQTYVAAAIALAHDRERLRVLRSLLRSRMAASPLCDGPRFAKDFEQVLRAAWHAFCRAPVT